ncbi:hypothetical protein ACLKA7_012803 [Drosophila subpalustris]
MVEAGEHCNQKLRSGSAAKVAAPVQTDKRSTNNQWSQNNSNNMNNSNNNNNNDDDDVIMSGQFSNAGDVAQWGHCSFYVAKIITFKPIKIIE